MLQTHAPTAAAVTCAVMLPPYDPVPREHWTDPWDSLASVAETGMVETHDGVIIGAGHNGLILANNLVRSGR